MQYVWKVKQFRYEKNSIFPKFNFCELSLDIVYLIFMNDNDDFWILRAWSNSACFSVVWFCFTTLLIIFQTLYRMLQHENSISFHLICIITVTSNCTFHRLNYLLLLFRDMNDKKSKQEISWRSESRTALTKHEA